MESDDYFHAEVGSVGARRGVMRRRSKEFEAIQKTSLETTFMASVPMANELCTSNGGSRSSSTSLGGVLHGNVLLGLSMAGVASTLLTTAYSMFHVDVFLKVYSLPLPTYSWGSLVVSVITTANDLASAWMVDHMATTRSRSDLVGVAGCIFALCFMAPFFRWRTGTSGNAAHFIFSLSLYDTMYSFVLILVASVVSDNHHMSDQTRMQYMASGKAANLVAAFIVARLGLSAFDVDNLMRFRIFVTFLALVAAVLFILAQSIVSQSTRQSIGAMPVNRHGIFGWMFPQRQHWHDDGEHDDAEETGPPAKLRWRQVVADLWSHKNFMAWIRMEVLLEAQFKFVMNFLKTFVDGLVLKEEGMETGMTRRQCDLFLSIIRPMMLVAGILIYIPIRKHTYPQVYRMLFYCNIILSLLLLLLVDLEAAPGSSVHWFAAYLFVYPVLTGAVRSAGFHLAQADMVLEMKRRHASEDRHDEPSLAGLFLGANMFFCKPCEAILPITAAQTLQRYESSKTSLFYLLTIPPIVCSVLQLVAWQRYDLTPSRTAKMRDELRSYNNQQGSKRSEIKCRELRNKRPLSPYHD